MQVITPRPPYSQARARVIDWIGGSLRPTATLYEKNIVFLPGIKPLHWLQRPTSQKVFLSMCMSWRDIVRAEAEIHTFLT
jgi:hypothetical protein